MFKKADLIVIAIIILLSSIFAFVFYIVPFEGEYMVNVYIDNTLTDSFPLHGDYVQLNINTVYGSNQLIISNGFAMINDADCSTRSCVSRGTISRPGSMIICAPHNLIIKIEAVEEE